MSPCMSMICSESSGRICFVGCGLVFCSAIMGCSSSGGSRSICFWILSSTLG